MPNGIRPFAINPYVRFVGKGLPTYFGLYAKPENALAVPNQIRGLLGDHDRRRIGVAAHDGRHDRGIDHPQSLDSVHLQAGIDDRHGVVAHLAGAGRVPGGGGRTPHEGFEIRVASEVRSRCHLLAPDVVEGFRVENLEVPAYSGDGAAHIVGMAQVVGVDDRPVKRIGRGQRDRTAAERTIDIGGERDAVPVGRSGFGIIGRQGHQEEHL